ncbi:MAG: glycosyltransferase family 2 protein [Anaerolineales bacterium]|nr:glycosyltransferase family 2 protein [Anaerolineales bacterium]MCX7754162.1 glycosyltransferase family 2 protein [Anaerolineales bacterium]MDW8278076.1 glycosyltransferase family 2 protein [Anaerolineales bacterium]
MAFLFWFAVFFILYVYFGYPLLVALLARFRPARLPELKELPSVTLLIAAYNEEKVIASKLENSLALDYPREKLQILVAADGSSDRTPEIVRQFEAQGVELNYIPERNGKMAALVRAMPRARGSIVVISDANNMYNAQAIRELVKPYGDPKVGATTGAKLILEDERQLSFAEGFYWKYESWIKENETRLSTCTSAVGEMLSIRKELFQPPTRKIVNDDRYTVFSLIRRGYRVYYNPAARSYETVSKTARDEIVRRTRMVAGAYQTVAMAAELLPFNRPLVLWQVISHKYLRAYVPFAMILALVSNLMLVLFPAQSGSFWQLAYPFNWIFLGLQAAFYALAVLGNFVRFKGPIGKLLYLPTFLVNSNYAVLMGLFSFLTNKNVHLWQRVER